MRSARILLVVGVVVFMLSLTVVAGCTGEPPKGPVSPGVESGALGGMEVIGYLADADGVWTVFAADPTSSEASGPEALATLVAGSVDEGGIAALDGRYVWAAGRSSDDEADTPEIKVDGIDVAVEPQQ